MVLVLSGPNNIGLQVLNVNLHVHRRNAVHGTSTGQRQNKCTTNLVHMLSLSSQRKKNGDLATTYSRAARWCVIPCDGDAHSCRLVLQSTITNTWGKSSTTIQPHLRQSGSVVCRLHRQHVPHSDGERLVHAAHWEPPASFVPGEPREHKNTSDRSQCSM